MGGDRLGSTEGGNALVPPPGRGDAGGGKVGSGSQEK